MVDNFQNKYTYGNKKNKGIKIAHWNKGGSFLTNKMPEIRNVIEVHKPHILGVSEANLVSTYDPRMVAIPDYDLHLNPKISKNSTSRIVVFTHKDLVAKLRPDLMDSTFSSIWLEVGLPHGKKFLVCQLYREWQLLDQQGDKSSGLVSEQLNRWHIFIN